MWKSSTNSTQVYNTTFVRWTTHHPAGLSMLDCEMATFCDQAAAMLGEVVSDGPQQSNKTKATTTEETKPENAGMCGLTDRAVKAGGDCCVPKSKSSQKTAQAQQEGTNQVEGEELHDKGP